jgi:hypothetical protein
MANRRDDYMNKRSWLIDTAETPADKKRLKSDLAKLDKKFNPNRVASTPKAKTTGVQATKKAVERAVGKAKFAAGMRPTAKKMTQNKPAMKPGKNPVIGAKAKTTVKKAGKK